MSPSLRRLRRFLLAPLVLLAALIFAFEDWLWDPLTRLIARIMRWPVLRWLDAAVRALPPYGALIVLLAPAGGLLPIKLAGLALIAHGHAGAGLSLFVLAKVAGTALLAWLWGAVQPQVRRIGWAARAVDGLLRLKAYVYGWVMSWALVVLVRRRMRRWGERTRTRWRAWRAASRLASINRR